MPPLIHLFDSFIRVTYQKLYKSRRRDLCFGAGNGFCFVAKFQLRNG